MPYKDWGSIVGNLELREKLLSNYTEDPKTGCWNWRGGTNNRYGAFYVKRKALLPAHRAAYILLIGPFPWELQVCHHCDNKVCINPEHLFLGTQKDNTLDAIRKGRRSGYRQAYRQYPPYFRPEQDRQIADLKAQGLSISEIARRFHCSRQPIYSALKRI